MCHKVTHITFVDGSLGWVASQDYEIAFHRRVLRRAILRGQLMSLINIHGNFDIGNRAA